MNKDKTSFFKGYFIGVLLREGFNFGEIHEFFHDCMKHMENRDNLVGLAQERIEESLAKAENEKPS